MKNVDDEINPGVKLLFIANSEAPLEATFSFLRKRGWELRFVSDVKKALEEIVVDRPTHVLISWNLTGANIAKIERTVVRDFKIPCIVFTEKDLDGKKQHALVASGIKHYMLTHVSGNSVYVKVRALLAAGPSAWRVDDAQDMMFIRGDWTEKPPEPSLQVKGQRGAKPPPSLAATGPAPENGGSQRFSGEKKPKAGLHISRGEKKKRKTKKRKSESYKKAPLLHFSRGKTEVFGRDVKSSLAQSALACIETQVAGAASRMERVPLTVVSHLDCVPIHSKNHTGLLVFATSAARHCGNDFSRAMKREIGKLLGLGGEILRDEGEVEIEVAPFAFLEVAKAVGEFATVTECEGVEVGMTFLRSREIFPELPSPNKANMIQVDLDSVTPDEKIDFDAFIHLPLNDKYIRYVKRGGTLAASQKEKMLNFKVKHFFIKNNDVKHFKGHFASHFVERLVREFLAAVKRKAA
jgi:hypothetical protein